MDMAKIAACVQEKTENCHDDLVPLTIVHTHHSGIEATLTLFQEVGRGRFRDTRGGRRGYQGRTKKPKFQGKKPTSRARRMLYLWEDWTLGSRMP